MMNYYRVSTNPPCMYEWTLVVLLDLTYHDSKVEKSMDVAIPPKILPMKSHQ